jgi:hypothetical protein
MLSTLRPGVREIQARLAAGYLWLIVAWLLLNDRIPEEQVAEQNAPQNGATLPTSRTRPWRNSGSKRGLVDRQEHPPPLGRVDRRATPTRRTSAVSR